MGALQRSLTIDEVSVVVDPALEVLLVVLGSLLVPHGIVASQSFFTSLLNRHLMGERVRW